MNWYVELSLDGWEFDSLGPVSLPQALVIARVIHKRLGTLYGKAHITTKYYEPNYAREDE